MNSRPEFTNAIQKVMSRVDKMHFSRIPILVTTVCKCMFDIDASQVRKITKAIKLYLVNNPKLSKSDITSMAIILKMF